MKLSVVVPVLNGKDLLPRCLDALTASTLDPTRWDLVVADDGSRDGTAALVTARGTAVRPVPGGPRGPAAARNHGAKHTDGDILVFVDADVCVAPDALERFAARFEGRPELGAAFGAYDEAPEQPDFFSQYRNLFHRWVHLRGAGPAETFWAGCGAVRRSVFEEVGGFDADRYPRPQIEDIELGYRIRDLGHPILLDPSIECRHLKRWSLAGIVRTDLLDRGVPWMRLLLERRRQSSLNVGPAERARTAVVGAAVLALAAAAVVRSPEIAALASAAFGAVVLSNLHVYRWFASLRGAAFALRVVGMNLLYYTISCAAAAAGVLAHLANSRARSPR